MLYKSANYPQIIKSYSATLSQEAIDTLITETLKQKWYFFWYYINTNNISHEGETNVQTAYYFEKGHSCNELTQKFNK